MRMDIKDVFIHEAAHVLVYHALDIRLKGVWIEEDANGVSEGATERGIPLDLQPAPLVLEFMAGAAALLNLTPLPFDRVIKKTTTDFCIALKHLKSLSQEEAKHNLQRLETAIQGFVLEWTRTHAQMIVNLASHLQQQQVRPGRYELDGDSLHSGIESNWRSKPSLDQVTTFAEQGWAEVQRAKMSAEPADWHDEVLSQFASIINS
jgi:hypothetical protein